MPEAFGYKVRINNVLACPLTVHALTFATAPLSPLPTSHEVEAYHKSHYFPGNAVVYLVGDLELSQMEAQLTQVTRMGDDDWLTIGTLTG